MTIGPDTSLDDIGAHLADGGIIILAGDALRDGDLDFAAAASRITPEAINFMARHGRGLICLGLSQKRAWHLGIRRQHGSETRSSGRPFGVSIEASQGVDTGISAYDRAHTISVAVAHDSGPNDLVTPGHVFPLIADEGGLASRTSTLEGGLELCKRFGLGEGIVLCAILREDGAMARVDDMQQFARDNNTPIVDIGSIASPA